MRDMFVEERASHFSCTCVFGSTSGADGFSMKEFPLGSSSTIVKGRSMPKNIIVIFWRTPAIFAVATGSISCLVLSVEQHKNKHMVTIYRELDLAKSEDTCLLVLQIDLKQPSGECPR